MYTVHWQDCMWSEIIMVRVSHVSYPCPKLRLMTVTLELISQLKYFRVDNRTLVVESAVWRFEIWLVNNLSIIPCLYEMMTYDDSKRYRQASCGVSVPIACPKPLVGDCFWFIYARSEELKKTQSPTQKAWDRLLSIKLSCVTPTPQIENGYSKWWTAYQINNIRYRLDTKD